MTCPCGCRREVNPGRTYASTGCAGRVRFRQDSPQMRAWKANAGRASGRIRHRELLETARGLTPIQALALGMRIGFNRAEKRWKRWAEQQRRRVA